MRSLDQASNSKLQQFVAVRAARKFNFSSRVDVLWNSHNVHWSTLWLIASSSRAASESESLADKVRVQLNEKSTPLSKLYRTIRMRQSHQRDQRLIASDWESHKQTQTQRQRQRQRQKKAIKEETEPRLKIDLATSQRPDPTTVFTL